MNLAADERGRVCRILEEATAWANQAAEGRRTASEQQAFENWLTADPEHMAAYELASRTWADLGEVSGLAPERVAHGARSRIDLNWLFGLLRPSALAALGLACALALVGVFVGPRFLSRPPQFATQVAQITPITLQDGSVVTLGARSAIDADFSDASRRQVMLRRGEAFFEVARNPERPFYVMAADVAVRVVGTKFDVRRGAEQTTISVREGVVEVTANNERHRLHAGDQAIVEHSTTLFVRRPVATQIAAVTPNSVAAWRQGRLDYAGTPLSELVADLNRYYRPKVEIASPEIGELRVTASFPANDAEGAIQDLGQLFPTVEVERRSNGRYILRSRPGAQ